MMPVAFSWVPVLVRKFVKAAHELTRDKRPPAWVAIDRVVARLGVRDSGTVNVAIAYAVAHRLLRVDTADDPLSVTVIAEGVKQGAGRSHGVSSRMEKKLWHQLAAAGVWLVEVLLGSKPNKAWSPTSNFGSTPDIGHAGHFVRV